MPPSSSRHRTHRSKKHRDRWDVEPEKEEEENVKKRKDGADEVYFLSERWNGEFDDRCEEILDVEGDVDIEKIEEVKVVAVDSKSKFSRRSEFVGEKRSCEKEKELTRREIGGGRRKSDVKVRERDSGTSKEGEFLNERNKDYGFVKGKDRRMESEKDTRSERDSEGNKDRKRWSKEEKENGMGIVSVRDGVVDRRKEKFTDIPRRNSEIGGDGKSLVKGVSEIPERQLQNQLLSPGHEKDLQKQMGKDSSVEKGQWLGSERGKDDKKLHVVDDCRGSSYYGKGHKEGRYREKHPEEFDRDQRRQDHWHHSNIKYENKHHRTEDKQLDMHNDSRIIENDHDGNWKKDKHSTNCKDVKGSKRSIDDNESQRSLKSSIPSFGRANDHKKDLHYYKVDDADLIEPESRNSGHVVSTPRRSTMSIASASKEDDGSTFKEGDHKNSAYSVDHVRVSNASGRGMKSRTVDDRVEKSVPSKHEKTRLDGYASPTYSTDKRSSSKGNQYSKKKTGGHSGDIEEISNKKSYSRDGKETRDDSSLPSPSLSGTFSISDSRHDYFSGSSPSRILPARHGVDSHVLVSLEENRSQAGDRKSSEQYRRSEAGHPTAARGQVFGWRGVANWSSPIANGFVPFHHGPSPGFHPVAQHFSSPFFDVRPFMEMHHAITPFHVHGTSERFPAHNLPSGWQTSDDSCYPNLQGWEQSRSVTGDDSHMYGRHEWKHNRQLVKNRSREIDDEKQIEIQNSNSLSDHPKQSKMDDTGSDQADTLIHKGHIQSELHSKLMNDSEVKACIGTPAKDDAGIPNSKRQKLSNTRNLPDDNHVSFCRSYLAVLDISLDLIPQELYDKCTGILCPKGMVIDGASAPFGSQVKSAVVTASKRFGYRPFPQLSDDVFKKATALYEMGNEERKVKLSSILPLQSDGTPSNKLEDENPNSNEITKSTVAVISLPNPVKEGCSVIENIPRVIGKESGTISDAVVFTSQSSPVDDRLMPDCLCQIHGCPESTH